MKQNCGQMVPPDMIIYVCLMQYGQNQQIIKEADIVADETIRTDKLTVIN